MKNTNLFIVKRITENIQISDEAFVVWCALRSIMEKNETEYFVNHNVLAWRIFNRVGNRTELESIKAGFNELVNLGYVKILFNCNKSDHIVDLSSLYYSGNEFFATITLEEMHKIMNIEGRHDKYKLLRYFTCQVGSFNQSDSMMDYKGKIGGLKHKGQTKISHRGRKRLRYWLVQAATSTVSHADEYKQLHEYYTTRSQNPLKKKQSLVVVACKILRVIYTILKTGATYDPKKLLKDIKHPEIATAQIAA